MRLGKAPGYEPVRSKMTPESQPPSAMPMVPNRITQPSLRPACAAGNTSRTIKA